MAAIRSLRTLSAASKGPGVQSQGRKAQADPARVFHLGLDERPGEPGGRRPPPAHRPGHHLCVAAGRRRQHCQRARVDEPARAGPDVHRPGRRQGPEGHEAGRAEGRARRLYVWRLQPARGDMHRGGGGLPFSVSLLSGSSGSFAPILTLSAPLARSFHARASTFPTWT